MQEPDIPSQAWVLGISHSKGCWLAERQVPVMGGPGWAGLLAELPLEPSVTVSTEQA